MVKGYPQKRSCRRWKLFVISVGCPHIWSSIRHCIFTVVPVGVQWEEVGVLLYIVVMVKEQSGSEADAVWLRLSVMAHIHHEPVSGSEPGRGVFLFFFFFFKPQQMPWTESPQQGWCHTDLTLHPSATAAAFTAHSLPTAVWSICRLQITYLKVSS